CIGNLRPSPHPIRSLYLFHLLFSILRPPPDPTLFPYTTLFRSAVYASFGRMYTLLAFAGALAADTFVRALDLRTGGAAAVAAGAAWLLPAVHPYGGLLSASEAAIALVLCRGRPLRPALPATCLRVARPPFARAHLPLAHR